MKEEKRDTNFSFLSTQIMLRMLKIQSDMFELSEVLL
jgi:hypothetical protein